MKYIKYFEDIKNSILKEVVEKIMSGEEKPEEISNYLDIQENHGYLEVEKDELSFDIKIDDFEDLLEIERGVIEWLRFANSYGYEFYIDDDEVNYIHHYMTTQQIQKVLNFAKYLDNKIDYVNNNVDEGEFAVFFENFDLEEIKDSFKYSLSIVKEKALSILIEKEISNEQPFYYDFIYTGKYQNGVSVTVEYDALLKYIKDKDINSIGDFFRLVGNNLPYTYDIEYQSQEYESKKDYQQLQNDLEFEIDRYWDNESKLPEDFFWVNVVYKDNVDILKEHFDDILWQYKMKSYSRLKYLVEFAKPKSKCYKWFASRDFSNKIKNLDDKELNNIINNIQSIYNAQKLGIM